MTYRKRILYDLAADIAGNIIMDIASADTNRSHLNENITIVFYDRVRDFAHFHLVNAG